LAGPRINADGDQPDNTKSLGSREKPMSRLISSVCLTLLALAPYAVHADVTGTWTSSFDTQVGTQNYTYEFQVDGTTLTGKATSANGETALESGKVEGSTISFVEKLTFQGMELIITYTGEIVSDNEIRFTRDVAGFAKEPLVATRTQ
jgi:hypothetical protein